MVGGCIVCGLGLCWGSMNAGLEVGSGDRIKSESVGGCEQRKLMRSWDVID